MCKSIKINMLLILIIFNYNCLFSNYLNLISFNIHEGIQTYYIDEINNALSSASLPNIKNYSFLWGLSYSTFTSSSYDSNLYKIIFDEFKYKSFSTFGIFSNSQKFIFDKHSDIINPYFKNNFILLERSLVFDLLNTIELNLSYGFVYSWGSLTISKFINESDDFKKYISNPDIIHKFSFDGISFKLSLGFNIPIFTKTTELPNKINKFTAYICPDFSFFSPMFYNNGDFSFFQKFSLHNEIDRAVPGLQTNFPFGFLIQLKLKFESIEEIKH